MRLGYLNRIWKAVGPTRQDALDLAESALSGCDEASLRQCLAEVLLANRDRLREERKKDKAK